MKFINQLKSKAERHYYASILPPKEACMLLEDTPYITGSDYPKEVLDLPISDWIAASKCGYCRGKGKTFHSDGPDDYTTELCEVCEGKGTIN